HHLIRPLSPRSLVSRKARNVSRIMHFLVKSAIALCLLWPMDASLAQIANSKYDLVPNSNTTANANNRTNTDLIKKFSKCSEYLDGDQPLKFFPGRCQPPRRTSANEPTTDEPKPSSRATAAAPVKPSTHKPHHTVPPSIIDDKND